MEDAQSEIESITWEELEKLATMNMDGGDISDVTGFNFLVTPEKNYLIESTGFVILANKTYSFSNMVKKFGTRTENYIYYLNVVKMLICNPLGFNTTFICISEDVEKDYICCFNT